MPGRKGKSRSTPRRDRCGERNPRTDRCRRLRIDHRDSFRETSTRRCLRDRWEGLAPGGTPGLARRRIVRAPGKDPTLAMGAHGDALPTPPGPMGLVARRHRLVGASLSVSWHRGAGGVGRVLDPRVRDGSGWFAGRRVGPEGGGRWEQGRRLHRLRAFSRGLRSAAILRTAGSPAPAEEKARHFGLGRRLSAASCEPPSSKARGLQWRQRPWEVFKAPISLDTVPGRAYISRLFRAATQKREPTPAVSQNVRSRRCASSPVIAAYATYASCFGIRKP
jgi:hypothetical protein